MGGDMPKSQNGYPANNRSLVSSRVIPGTSRKIALRNGPAGDLLLWFAAAFDRHVEDIEAPVLDDWGYAERPIRGGTQLSNHASGTAIDLNATRHPLGARGTFSPARAAAIRVLLNSCEGCVRWGGDYTGRKDEMHFEIVRSEGDCGRVLEKLRAMGSDDMSAECEQILMERTKQLVAICDGYYVAAKEKYGEPWAMQHDVGRAVFDVEQVVGSFYAAAQAKHGTQWADEHTFGKAMFELYETLTKPNG